MQILSCADLERSGFITWENWMFKQRKPTSLRFIQLRVRLTEEINAGNYVCERTKNMVSLQSEDSGTQTYKLGEWIENIELNGDSHYLTFHNLVAAASKLHRVLTFKEGLEDALKAIYFGGGTFCALSGVGEVADHIRKLVTLKIPGKEQPLRLQDICDNQDIWPDRSGIVIDVTDAGAVVLLRDGKRFLRIGQITMINGGIAVKTRKEANRYAFYRCDYSAETMTAMSIEKLQNECNEWAELSRCEDEAYFVAIEQIVLPDESALFAGFKMGWSLAAISTAEHWRYVTDTIMGLYFEIDETVAPSDRWLRIRLYCFRANAFYVEPLQLPHRD